MSSITNYDKVLENDVFLFLDDLRESGSVNMFGATPYLREEFGLTESLAREYLKNWMDTFEERHKGE